MYLFKHILCVEVPGFEKGRIDNFFSERISILKRFRDHIWVNLLLLIQKVFDYSIYLKGVERTRDESVQL